MFSSISSQALDDYNEVFETAMDGLHMEVRINVDQCDGGMNFTGITAGAYLREMIINNPDSNDS